MKKLITIALLTVSFALNAHLIHWMNISNAGPRGYKRVSSYEGLLVEIHTCKNPGMINCPFIDRVALPDGTPGPITLTEEAYKTAPDLPAYAKDFITSKQSLAFNSTNNNGMFTSTFLVNGENVVLTAKYHRTNNGTFKFKVVSNSTFAANIAELNASDSSETND